MNSLLSYALLTGVSVSYMSASRRLEHLRLVVSRRHVSTMLGIFTFAGVIVLPTLSTSLLVVTVYAAAWPTFRGAGMPLHRWIYNTGTGVAACLGASLALRVITHPVAAIAGGIVAFIAINVTLIAAVILATGHRQALGMLRNPRTHIGVATTQILGAVVGELMTWHQPAGLVVLPALYAFHQWSARGTVEDTKAFDTVGGVWSEDAWLALAANAMDERKWFSVLIIDAGGAQFRETAVAELRAAGLVRDDDTVGGHADPAMIAVMLIDTPGPIARLLGRAMTAHLAQGGIQAAIGSADSRAESLHETVMHAYSDAIIQRAHSSSRAELL